MTRGCKWFFSTRVANKIPWLQHFKLIFTKTRFYCSFRLKTGYLERGHESRLVINNVTYDYQGEYECRATNQINGQERTVASEPVSLQVVGKCSFNLTALAFSLHLLCVCHSSQNEREITRIIETPNCMTMQSQHNPNLTRTITIFILSN